jgi:hypothetical protein
MSYSKRRAIFATIIFSVAGILAWPLFVYDWHVSLPLAIFYALLVINTYPSVRLFSSIVPQDHGKHALADIILAISYLCVAASIGNPPQFAVCALVMFLIAAAKYTLMLYEIPHPHLIQRKVRIDLLGALMCAGILALMNFGWILSAAWMLAILFAAANIYVLRVNPLYRL